jgi:hypothetical protein
MNLRAGAKGGGVLFGWSGRAKLSVGLGISADAMVVASAVFRRWGETLSSRLKCLPEVQTKPSNEFVHRKLAGNLWPKGGDPMSQTRSYSPKIRRDLVAKLYWKAQALHVPMTKLVDCLVAEGLVEYRRDVQKGTYARASLNN